MNRDERRTRARGLPPAPLVVRDVPVLLPTDPDAGGSWVSVNRLGLSLALLNRFEESPHDPSGTFTSRGLLIRGLCWLASPDQVYQELGKLPLLSYRPFTLASLARGGLPHLYDWNGRVLGQTVIAQPGLIRASSGSDQLRAEQVRGAIFRAAAEEPDGLTAAVLERLHRSHLPEKGPLSICMHRQEAMTVSLSLVTVDGNTMSIFYVDGPPGETTGGVAHTL